VTFVVAGTTDGARRPVAREELQALKRPTLAIWAIVVAGVPLATFVTGVVTVAPEQRWYPR